MKTQITSRNLSGPETDPKLERTLGVLAVRSGAVETTHATAPVKRAKKKGARHARR